MEYHIAGIFRGVLIFVIFMVASAVTIFHPQRLVITGMHNIQVLQDLGGRDRPHG